MEILKLDDYEAEDVGEVVFKLQKSFGISFKERAFLNVKTFGDVCDIFESQIMAESREDCTKQQAFYKIRKSISWTLQLKGNEVSLESKLIDLFPRDNRRHKIRELQEHAGLKLRILTCADWVTSTFLVLFLLSSFAFFFDWKVAISGIAISITSMKIAETFGNSFTVQTVRQLAEKAARECYSPVRRTANTVNRKEILSIIVETFSCDLDIDQAYLTRDAKFAWA